MARFRRAARTSRTITALVVVALFVGAAVQLRRVQAERAANASAIAATSMAGVHPAAGTAMGQASSIQITHTTSASTQPAVVAIAPARSAFMPLMSTTPTLGEATPARLSASPMVAGTTPSLTSPTGSTMAITPQPASANPAMLTSLGTGTHSLSEAQTEFANGDLVNARKTLNDALESGTLSPADAADAKQHIAQINQTLIFSTDKFVDDPFGGVVLVKPGQRLSSIANEQKLNWQLLCDLNHLSDARKLRSGQRLKVLQGPFTAIVTKHDFTMDLYLGGAPGTPTSMYVRSFPIGLGKDDSTPTGTWLIANRVKNPTYYSPRGEGVIDAGDPKNPLGPCWMGLTGTNGQAVGKESYGIHGTIEPDSIGHMASMGCIRMHNEDALAVFQLLTEGKSTVVVRD